MPGSPAAANENASVLAGLAAARRRHAEEPEIRERRRRLTQDRRGLRRAEDRQAARAAGAAVDVEVGRELCKRRLGLFEGAELLANVRLRAEQTLLFPAPQRDANRPPRLDADRHQDPRRFHHHGTTNGVVGRTSGGVPRIEMAAEHHDLVGLVAARDLGDDVVARSSLRVRPVDDVEFELDGTLVVEQAPDPPVVLVPHDDDRRRLGLVEGTVVERADLTVVSSGIGDPDEDAVCHEKRVELFVELIRRQRAARRVSAVPAGSALGGHPPRPAGGRGAVICVMTSLSSRLSGAGVERDLHLLRSIHKDDLSLDHILQ